MHSTTEQLCMQTTTELGELSTSLNGAMAVGTDGLILEVDSVLPRGVPLTTCTSLLCVQTSTELDELSKFLNGRNSGNGGLDFGS